MAPSILLSFSLIRIVRPGVQILAQHHWAAFALLVYALFVVLQTASKIVAYGALLGLYQRVHVDGRSASDVSGATPSSAAPAHAMTENVSQMRLLACCVAAVVYIWQEQREFSFPRFISRSSFLASAFCPLACACSCAARGRIQPPSRRPALHRSAQFGNLRNPACRLRTPCKVGARSRPLTRKRHFLVRFDLMDILDQSDRDYWMGACRSSHVNPKFAA